MGPMCWYAVRCITHTATKGLLSQHYAVCLIQPPMQSYHIAQWYIYQAKGVYRQHLHNTSFYGQHCNPPGILLCQLTGYRDDRYTQLHAMCTLLGQHFS